MPILANQETCTACMACLNACAKGAISFVQDNESFLQPQVDADRCVECHLCEKVCPEIQQEFYQHDAAGDVYAGWNKTDRQVSSSGGAFSSIARYVLAKGGVVYGSTLDENLECKHIEVTDIAGLDKLRGSKYMQSATGTISILPALPSAWSQGKVTGLKAVGDFTVDIEWKSGKASVVSILNNQGQPLRVKLSADALAEAVFTVNGAQVETTLMDDGSVLVPSEQAGDNVIIVVGKETGIAQAASTVNASDVAYDLSGRQTCPNQKGIFIVNGEKQIK